MTEDLGRASGAVATVEGNSADEFRDLHIECECAGKCTAVVFRDWFKDEPMWFEFWSRVNSHAYLSWRIKTAWNILFRRDHYLDTLVLNDADLARIRDFLDESLTLRAQARADSWKAANANTAASLPPKSSPSPAPVSSEETK